MAPSRWPAAIVTVVLMQRSASRSSAMPGRRLPLRRLAGRRARAHALPAAVRREPSRPGAVLDRPGLHGGRGGRLPHGRQQQIIRLPPGCRAGIEVLGVGIGRYRLFIIVICGLLAIVAAAGALPHPLRQPAPRGRGRRPRGARARHPCRRASSRSPSRSGSGLAGLGGALGVELLGARSDLPAEVHDLLPDRRDGRRHVAASPARSWPRCCSASPMSPASTGSRRSAPSSSTS